MSSPGPNPGMTSSRLAPDNTISITMDIGEVGNKTLPKEPGRCNFNKVYDL
jgi:hypothetical protein